MNIFSTLTGPRQDGDFRPGRGCGPRRFPRYPAGGGTSQYGRVLRGHCQPASVGPRVPGCREEVSRMETHRMIVSLLAGLMSLWLA
jgi:hypothetical protein